MPSALITWDHTPLTKGYFLSYKLNGQPNILSLDKNTNSYIIDDIDHGDSLSVSVKAWNDNGVSPEVIETSRYSAVNPNFIYIFDDLYPAEVVALLQAHNLCTANISTNNIPERLRGHGILCWLNYRKFLTTSPVNVINTLKTLYANNPSLCLSNISRRDDLIKGFFLRDTESFPDKLKYSNSTPDVYCWVAPVNTTATPNLLIPETIFYNSDLSDARNVVPTPQNLSTLINNKPIGQRFLRILTTSAYVKLNGVWKAYFFDGVPDNGYLRIWMEKWKTFVSNMFHSYFNQCKTLNIPIEGAYIDIEQDRSIFKFKQDKNPTGQNTPHLDIQLDNKFSAFLNELGMSINDINSLMTWHNKTDPRTIRWNEVVYQQIAKYIVEATYDVFKQYYPDAWFTSYDHCYKSGGLYPWHSSAKRYASPIGAGVMVGTHTGRNFYPAIFTSQDMWWPHTNTTGTLLANSWHNLLNDYFGLLSSAAAHNALNAYWIQPPSISNITPYERAHLAMVMLGNAKHIYWNSRAIASDDILVSEVANEIYTHTNGKVGKTIVGPIHTSLPNKIELSVDFEHFIKTITIDSANNGSYSIDTESKSSFYRRKIND